MAMEREQPPSIDRISNLPCAIVDHILTLLPLRDAVRTSTLSKQWKNSWLTIPHLVIDPNFKASLPKVWTRQLDFIIYRLLLCHKGSILKFSIDVVHRDIGNSRAIDNWLCFLLNHHSGIQDLELLLGVPYIGDRILHCLFSFENVSKLHLEAKDVVFKLPSSFLGFSKLLKLHLEVGISFQVLKEFVSKCPLLEFFTLYNERWNKQMRLYIIAPNLKCFEFNGWFNSICLETPRIEKITFREYSDGPCLPGTDYNEVFDPEVGSCNLTTVFSQMSSVKELHIEQSVLDRFDCKGRALEKCTVNFNHLHYLCIDGIYLEEISDVSIVVCLIKNSPILQNLHLILDNYASMEPATAIQYIREQQNCQFPLSGTLKNVLIEAFYGLEEEVEFVKLLLLSATVLQKVEIKCGPRYSDSYLNAEKLASFPRASPEAVVLFS